MKFVGEYDVIFLLVILSSSHLSGLNAIDQLDSHFSSSCRSACRISGSEGEFIVR